MSRVNVATISWLICSFWSLRYCISWMLFECHNRNCRLGFYVDPTQVFYFKRKWSRLCQASLETKPHVFLYLMDGVSQLCLALGLESRSRHSFLFKKTFWVLARRSIYFYTKLAAQFGVKSIEAECISNHLVLVRLSLPQFK